MIKRFTSHPSQNREEWGTRQVLPLHAFKQCRVVSLARGHENSSEAYARKRMLCDACTTLSRVMSSKCGALPNAKLMRYSRSPLLQRARLHLCP